MQYMQFTAARADTGASLPLARVTVYLTGTSTKASLFDNVGSAISNPVTASTVGLVSFAAADGIYDIAIQSSDGLYNTPTMVGVQIFDLSAIATAVALIPGKANLTSPTFTGVPAAPTASAGTNTTQVATTAFVTAAVGVLTTGADAAHNTFLKLQNILVADEATAAALAVTVGGKLTAASNLSDLANTTTARQNLGVRIGIDVQAFSTPLAALSSGAIWAAGVQVPVFTAAGTVVMKTVGTSSGNLLDKAAGDALYAPIGSTGGVSNGTYGDIVVTLGGTNWAVGAGAITYAKIQNAAAAGLMGALAAGVFGLIPVGTGLALSGGSLVCTVSGSTTYDIQTRTALAAISSPANGTGRYLAESGREGWFIFNSSNLSTQVTADPGQGLYVPPAAATSGASGAWVRVWSDRLNAKWFGCVGDGTTNDLTNAQRAVNYAAFIGSAEVFFPIGVYNFGSSGLLLSLYNGSQWKTIKITGAGCVQEFGTALSFTMPTTGTMFISTATTGAVITVAAGSGTYAPFSGYCLYIEDLTVRVPSNPSCSGIDLSNALQSVLRNVEVDTGVYSNNVTAWSTTTSAGIITPANNNAALTELYNVAVSGFYKGIVMNEHANVIGGNVTGCANALWYEFGNHSSWYQGKLQNNVQNFVINGACVFSAHVNIEHAASGAQITTADIKDVGSLCVEGEIVWSIVTALVGQDTGFLRTGGNNIVDRRVGTFPGTPVSVYRMASNLSVANSTDTALTFAKSSGGGETSLHAGDATKIDINTSGTYRVSFIGAWAANGTGDRVIAIDHHHGAIDIVAKAAQPAASASNETCQSCISTAIPYSGGAGEYLQVLVNQLSGGALNLLGGVNRSGVLTIEKLA